MEELNFKDINKEFFGSYTRYIYHDKAFEPRGIDYQHYIKLRFDSINDDDIKHKYSVEGWYLLWYLMSKAQRGQYIETTINTVIEDIKLKNIKIKELLLFFHNANIIKLNKIKLINYNTPLKIHILYNNDELYKNYKPNGDNGYRAIPIDFAREIIPTLTAEEWSIYCVLVVRYNYFTIDKEFDIATGKPYYPYKENQYAFPTLIDIEKNIGIPQSTVRRYLTSLENNQYKLIEIHNEHLITVRPNKKTGKVMPQFTNNTYSINLLDRIEYMYYHLIRYKDERDTKLINKINKEGFKTIRESDLCTELRPRDYIIYKYGENMRQFEECIKLNNDNEKEKAKEKYKTMGKFMKLN